MASFRVTGTNHTSFTVSNLDHSISYFCRILIEGPIKGGVLFIQGIKMVLPSNLSNRQPVDIFMGPNQLVFQS